MIIIFYEAFNLCKNKNKPMLEKMHFSQWGYQRLGVWQNKSRKSSLKLNFAASQHATSSRSIKYMQLHLPPLQITLQYTVYSLYFCC